mmetsp:Transcript_22573/g.67783  ORF Transcript_22573/g.67783 Transcript_22573/m.67783 type:complete len:229 (-) Transcript_22573:575-1261(-)
MGTLSTPWDVRPPPPMRRRNIGRCRRFDHRDVPVLEVQGQHWHPRDRLPIDLHSRQRPEQRWWLVVPPRQGVPPQHAEDLLGHVLVHGRRGRENLEILPPRIRQCAPHEPLYPTIAQLIDPIIVEDHFFLIEPLPLEPQRPRRPIHLWRASVTIHFVHNDRPQPRVHIRDELVGLVQQPTQLVRRANDYIGIQELLLHGQVADDASDGITLTLGKEAHAVNIRKHLHC